MNGRVECGRGAFQSWTDAATEVRLAQVHVRASRSFPRRFASQQPEATHQPAGPSIGRIFFSRFLGYSELNPPISQQQRQRNRRECGEVPLFLPLSLFPVAASCITLPAVAVTTFTCLFPNSYSTPLPDPLHSPVQRSDPDICCNRPSSGDLRARTNSTRLYRSHSSTFLRHSRGQSIEGVELRMTNKQINLRFRKLSPAANCLCVG